MCWEGEEEQEGINDDDSVEASLRATPACGEGAGLGREREAEQEG